MYLSDAFSDVQIITPEPNKRATPKLATHREMDVHDISTEGNAHYRTCTTSVLAPVARPNIGVRLLITFSTCSHAIVCENAV